MKPGKFFEKWYSRMWWTDGGMGSDTRHNLRKAFEKGREYEKKHGSLAKSLETMRTSNCPYSHGEGR